MIDLLKDIPQEYQGILPQCPCGCLGLHPQDAPPLETPPYAEELIASGRFETEFEVERFLIQQRVWEDEDLDLWDKSLKTPVDRALYHRMRFLRLFMPWITHDPNLVRLRRETLECEVNKRKLFHMIGHASSGKTHFMVADAFENLMLWPGLSECFVASPYKTASEYLLWAAFNEAADLLKAYGTPVYRKAGVLSLNDKVWAGPDTITLVAFHTVGVLRGKKMFDPDRGILGIYLDEAGEFTNDSILHIIANLKSQRNLRVRTGTNFRNIAGLDGKFNQPEAIPWPALSREESYSWDAVDGGYTVRLRAKVSPNIVLKEDYYRYLLKEEEHDALLKYGVDSPYYLAQGDAFPSVTSVNRILISEADIIGGSAYAEIELASGSEDFAFMDPSFSQHGDCAVMASGRLGKERMSSTSRIKCLELAELPINQTTRWDETLLDLAMKLRKGKPLKENFVEGELVDAFDLCALRAGEFLLDKGIPFENFAFDDSLRGKLSTAMVYFLGEGVEPIWYGGDPTNKLTFPPEYKWGVRDSKTKQRTRVRMTYKELCANIVSQMWLVAVAMLKAGYIRDGFVAQKAFEQLQLRLKALPKSGTSPTKISLESKDDYKDRNRQESPDHGDAWCGLVWMIVDRRLAPVPDSSNSSQRGGVTAVAKLLEMADSQPTRRIRRLRR